VLWQVSHCPARSAYRDAVKLLIAFAAQQTGKTPPTRTSPIWTRRWSARS
jgi:hypothetical protein